MKLKVSIGNSRMDKKWRTTEMELDEFRDRIFQTKVTAETIAEFKKMPKAQQDAIKDIGGFVLGTLKGGRRKKNCVLTRSALSLDMDYASTEVIEQVEMFFSFRCYFYSTHKHTPEAPRLRLIIPLSREVGPDEYMAVARKVAEEIDIEQFDDTTYEPSRLMYWPSTSSDGEFVAQEIDGDILDPDTILAKYTDWHNTAEWPVSRRQQIIVQREIKKQADPLTKAGMVWAFCRAYSVTTAIDTFLPDVYKHSSMPGRYDYIPADSQAGVVIYDDCFAYSHHATDPACGRLLNAFDVVRLHKFGALDGKADPDDPPSKLPSFQAMQDFAVQDTQVKLQLAKERQAVAESEFSAQTGDDWQTELELDKRGRVKDTLTNIAAIVRNDPNLQNIVYNEFKGMVDVIGPLPWKQVRPGWNDADLANAKLYFERVYGVWSPSKFKDALLAVVSAERLYHPVKEYLNGLTWDGTERLDTLLVEYMGAEDTAYVRAVTRKTLCAAVARIYEPGIKFDSMLVLNGPQGMGKSTFYALLGREWFSDSLSIADMRDKTAAEKLQGYYTRYIKSNQEWEFVSVYTDEGISGTNTKHRVGFNQMIADALSGKIDLIVTKSVSRFARNTVDSLTTIRKLKEHGVEVYFEKENIWTFDSKGELLITIMSSLAQEESRSLSENITWGQRKRFSDGKVSLPYKQFLGYRKGPDGFPEIVEDEAKIVRRIYALFMEGKTSYAIAKALTADGIPTPSGKKKWGASVVESILTNDCDIIGLNQQALVPQAVALI